MKLLITTGHNSSAILVQDNKVLIGYEEERLSKVKSDSAFPRLSIEKIISYYPNCVKEVDEIFIGHWFNTFEKDLNNKYVDSRYLKARFYNADIKTVDENLTHHDLHAHSTWNFLEDNKGLTIISDGFGNKEEVLSIYNDGKLVHRCYDLYSSFGLMYQYATSYIGSIENKDEYKFISYETMIDKKLIEYGGLLDNEINIKSKELIVNILNNNKLKLIENQKELIDVKKLANVKKTWHNYFDSIINKLIKEYKLKNIDKKPIIGYLVQSILERSMMMVINHFGTNENGVKLSGGVFNNAKLNNLIARNVQKIDIQPLCGDQGTALGFLNITFDDLFWGKREADFNFIKEGYNEVLKGNLEFGARSLLNTSVVSPNCTIDSALYLNKVLGRNNLMPMAFACTSEMFEKLFDDAHKLGKSKHYMTMSLDISERVSDEELEKIKGVLLYDPFRNKWTGRCQVIDTDDYVNKHKIIINTSLNAHGQPLLYDIHDYNRMTEIINENNH